MYPRYVVKFQRGVFLTFPHKVSKVGVIVTPVAAQVDEAVPLSSRPKNRNAASGHQSLDAAENSASEPASDTELQAEGASDGVTQNNQNNVSLISDAYLTHSYLCDTQIPSVDVPRDEQPRVLARTLSARFPEDYYIHPEFTTKYELVNELGAGGFGFVLQARRREDGRPVAVKFVSKAQDIPNLSIPWCDHAEYGRIPQEIRYLKVLRHENIIEMLDVYSSDTYVYIVRGLISLTTIR